MRCDRERAQAIRDERREAEGVRQAAEDARDAGVEVRRTRVRKHFERAYALQRPMDNDNLRGVTVSGTISSEFTLDGTSNIGSQARVAIQPPADAIQEFKVETAT